MLGGQMKSAFREKDMSGPRLRKCETISISTKDKSINYVAPSVFSLPSGEYCRIRRNLKAANLVLAVDKEVGSYVPKSSKTDHKFPTSIRRLIASSVTQLKRHPNMRFNSKEIAVLSQMYYTITENHVRCMTKDELKDFLRSSMGITNSHVLGGLARVTAQLLDPKSTKERSEIPLVNFILMLSIYLRGSLTERAEMAFEIMDIDRDGMLRKNYEFVQLLRGSVVTSIAALHPDFDPYQPIRDSLNYLEQIFHFGSTEGVNMERFKELALQQPWIIDCLLPITCQDVDKMVLQYLLSV
nr:EF hand calcium binding domain containing protein [Hymenolepis microstoma]